MMSLFNFTCQRVLLGLKSQQNMLLLQNREGKSISPLKAMRRLKRSGGFPSIIYQGQNFFTKASRELAGTLNH